MNRRCEWVKTAMLGIVAMGCIGVFGTTWKVNQQNGDDTAAATDDTGATPFLTIQAAIAKASANDTIKVDPGTYAGEATVSATYGDSRLYITKALTIEGTGTRGDTIVLGALGNDEDGMGEGAIRCVCTSANVTFKGITFKDGATLKGGDSAATSGGGSYDTRKTSSSCVFVDCAFVNCRGTRGGGARYGKFYRTLFKDCKVANGTGTTNGSAAREADLYFCMVENCSGSPVVAYAWRVINCTFLGNTGTYLITTKTTTGMIANCLILAGSSTISTAEKTEAATLDGTVTCGYLPTMARITVGSTCKERVLGGDTFAPLFGDYGILEGGKSADVGVASVKEELLEAYRDTDYEGNTVDWTDGKVQPGAIQRKMVAASGRVWVMSVNGLNMTVDGYAAYLGSTPSNYFHETTWPTTHLVQGTVADTTKYAAVARFDLLNEEGDTITTCRPPLDSEDRAHMIAPPVGTTVSWTGYVTSNLYWVDKNAEYDGEADGTEEKPYKSINAAISASSNLRVVKVKAGDYGEEEEGSQEVLGMKTRINMGSSGFIRLIGVDGAANTRILGAADPDATDENYGCGANAVRCIASEGNSMVSGFTFRDGHTCTGDASNNTTRGGAARSTGSMIFTDCLFEDNVALYGAAGFGCIYRKCKFRNNRALNYDGVLHGAIAADCVFENNPCESKAGIVCGGSTVYNCTFNESGRIFCESAFYNSVGFGSKSETGASKSATGSVVYGFSTSCSGVKTADPCFRDRENGNYHLATVSPAVGYGEPTAGYWWRYGGEDFEGNVYQFVNGKVISGAYQTLAPSAKVWESAGPSTGVSVRGVQFFDVGTGLEITAVDAATRIFKGFSINGEMVETGATYTYNPATAPIPGETIYAVYLSDWYVKDDGGDDANSGESFDLAKKTLKGALQYAVPGDTVHVAEGTYDEGTMLHSSLITGSSADTTGVRIPARAYVKGGVTLVAEGARENTVILGESDPDWVDDSERQGCGPKAVRCVTLELNATIRGFTIKGGRTDWENIESDNNQGAGVLATSRLSSPSFSRVENCEIRECRSPRAAGGINGMYYNTRFIGNYASKNAPAGRQGGFYGCYFNGNRGQSVLNYPDEVKGCTFGPDNGGAYAIGTVNATTALLINNTLFCSANVFNSNDAKSGVPQFDNCACPTGAKVPTGTILNNCVSAAAEDLAKLTDDGAPIAGENPVCEQGNLTLWTAAGLSETLDAAGNQRVMNGTMDVGCYEADWRTLFAKKISGNQFVCSAADSVVTLTDAGLDLGGGRITLVTAKDVPTGGKVLEITASDAVTMKLDDDDETTYTEAFRLSEGVHTLALGGESVLNRCRMPTGLVISVR